MWRFCLVLCPQSFAKIPETYNSLVSVTLCFMTLVLSLDQFVIPLHLNELTHIAFCRN